MDTNTIAIISTVVTASIGLAALILNQIATLRRETREDFDTLRRETREDFDTFRRETREDFATFRGEFATLRGEFVALREDFGELRTDVTGLKIGMDRIEAHLGLPRSAHIGASIVAERPPEYPTVR